MRKFNWHLPENWPKKLLVFSLWFVCSLVLFAAFDLLPEHIQLYISVFLFIGVLGFFTLFAVLISRQAKINREKQDANLRVRLGSKYEAWFGKNTE